MKVVKCDACGKEIENDRIFKLHFEVENINGFNSAKENDDELDSLNVGKLSARDYCLTCASILAGMDFGLFMGDEFESIGKEMEQSEEEKPKEKKTLDWDKCCALKLAGWTNKDIADEMNCSINTINQKIKAKMKEYQEERI